MRPLLFFVGGFSLLLCAAAPAHAQVQVIVGGPDPSPAPVAKPHKHKAVTHTAAPVSQSAEPTMVSPYDRPVQVQTALQQSRSYVNAPVATSTYGYSLRSRFVATAMQFLGTPYVWGGAAPGGFDCSGFVQYTLAMVGVRVPRLADDQFYSLPAVAQPEPGDLVFFQTYEPGPSHVGIYLGNGTFINSIANDVHISSFASNYFTSRYLGARRPISD
jgi:cell wall-associated NlpC family hydrolase